MIITKNSKNCSQRELLYSCVIPTERDNYSGYVLDELSYKKFDYRNVYAESIKEYINDYYVNVLSKIKPESILYDIQYSALVSDEDDPISLRNIVAEWLTLTTNEENIELGNSKVQVKRPVFIKTTLESVIKENINMHGFDSIYALRLYEKALRKEEQSKAFSEDINYSHYLVERAAGLKKLAEKENNEYLKIKDKVKCKRV